MLLRLDARTRERGGARRGLATLLRLAIAAAVAWSAAAAGAAEAAPARGGKAPAAASPSRSPFARRPESPRVDPAFRGIVVAAPAQVHTAAGTIVHGVLQVPEADLDGGAGALQALALVVTSPPANGPYGGGATYHHAWMPFRARTIRPADVERAGGLLRAWFTTALPKEIGPLPGGTLYLVASVGPHASEVVAIDVR